MPHRGELTRGTMKNETEEPMFIVGEQTLR